MSMDVFEEIRREMERLRRRIQEEIDRTLAAITGLQQATWSPDGSLQPLYQVYTYPDRYVVVVDLAGADTGTIEVKATRDTLIIEAKLQRNVSYSDIYGTTYGREVTFHSYRNVLPLPPDADPSGMRYRVRRDKLVEIIIPRRPGRMAIE
jgi:HSP20 family protein